jgi:hypothetical protein
LKAANTFEESFATLNNYDDPWPYPWSWPCSWPWIVVKLGYCSAIISNGVSVMYVNKFPPSDNTTRAPGLILRQGTPEELAPDQVTRKTLEAFWMGTGRNTHKKRWGRDNLATTSPTWCSGMFIGDQIKFLGCRQGIIPGRSPYDPNSSIIPGSEDWAVTALVQINGMAYKVYLTEGPMPQVAIDVLLVARFGSELWVKLLRRGSDINTVDNPNVLMSGAGEHCEPGTGTLKDQALDAITQESGLHPSDLKQSSMHVIGSSNASGRDPRYWKFHGFDEDTGEPVEFGYERESSTTIKLVFIDFGEFGRPTKTAHTDLTEVAYTFWIPLNRAISMDPSDFFLNENHMYLELARDYIHSENLLNQRKRKCEYECEI